MLISDKSHASAQSTILLDNETEVQFPINKKAHKQTLKMKDDVGIACQKVCKQGRDDSIKVKVSVIFVSREAIL